ncbi:TSSK6-activating co-chaperone protein [Meles meles]|uniref:TSSK6-activating co-chaperone protein n=1 Tax=Meles meles TaxID=9662 RepID=UPI001E69A4D4|nr:TSSK6-activating co-chaperone protein [Meles meles]
MAARRRARQLIDRHEDRPIGFLSPALYARTAVQSNSAGEVPEPAGVRGALGPRGALSSLSCGRSRGAGRLGSWSLGPTGWQSPSRGARRVPARPSRSFRRHHTCWCPDGAARWPSRRKRHLYLDCLVSTHSVCPKSKEESNAVPLCRAKPSPSFINLPASSPPATSLNIQKTKPPSGVGHKPTECLGLLECMYANLQLQAQLAQQQMAILENLQASMTQLSPGRGSKNCTLPALSRGLLFTHLPQPTK